MTRNVGGADRALRILAGLVIMAAGYHYGNGWGLVGLVPLATGLIGWCPAYLPFGLSTCRTAAH